MTAAERKLAEAMLAVLPDDPYEDREKLIEQMHQVAKVISAYFANTEFWMPAPELGEGTSRVYRFTPEPIDE